MDPLDNLQEAMLRVAASLRRGAGGGGRRPKKRKRVKAGGARPVGPGSNVACGTGKGGFGVGNQCAKEDGIPQKPLSQGGALKQPSAKKDFAAAKAMKAKAAAKQASKEAAAKAKSAAEKPKREKQKKIDKLRKAAADRKSQKDAKSADETKAAKEAVAKKKAAMLQKIRVKSANQKITIAGTPKSIKQELQELKLKKASEKLAVSSTPSIKQELEQLKASMQNLKKIAAPPPKPAPPPPPAVSPSSPSQSGKVGELQHKKQSSLSPSEKDQQNVDRERVFGKDTADGWSYLSGAGYKDVQKIKAAVKIKTSLDAAKRLDKMGIKESDVTDEMLKAFDSTNRYYGTSTAAKRLINDDGVPAEYHRRYALSAGMVDRWAQTSGDSDAKAVGMQYAIREELNVKGAYTRHLSPSNKSKQGAQIFKDEANNIASNKAVRAVIRAHYENTQARLKAAGITELTLVRGYDSSAKVQLLSDQNVSLQPASSFSMEKRIAAGFAGKKGKDKARHLVLRVPASRVLSTSVSGFGCLNEQEMVVLGGKVRGKVYKSAQDW